MASADVMVKIGAERYTSTLSVQNAHDAAAALAMQMTHVRGFKDFDMASASVVANRMMMSGLEGCHHDVCAAAWWLIFRRPGEEEGWRAHKALEQLQHETGGARIILVCDELCTLDSVHIHIAEPGTPDDDDSLDLTPRMSRMSESAT